MNDVEQVEQESTSTYERQMSAIIAKMLTDLEAMRPLQELHPKYFDRLRRRCIDAVWDGYVVGLNKGKNDGFVDSS